MHNASEEHVMVQEEPLMRGSDVLLALMLGSSAVLAMVLAMCGLGWSSWALWLCEATVGLVVAMRWLWSA
jgi:hypothetical protein